MMRNTPNGPLCNLWSTKAQISLRMRRLICAFVVRLQNQWILKYMSTNRECPDQTAWMRTLIWTLTVHKWQKGLFPMLCIICCSNFLLVRDIPALVDVPTYQICTPKLFGTKDLGRTDGRTANTVPSIIIRPNIPEMWNCRLTNSKRECTPSQHST